MKWDMRTDAEVRGASVPAATPSFMDSLESERERLEKLVWKRSLAFPKLPGVYLFSMSRRALYVGRASNLAERITSHVVSPWFRMIVDRFGEPDLRYCLLPESEIGKIEAALIRMLQPELNMDFSGRPRSNAFEVRRHKDSAVFQLAKLVAAKEKKKLTESCRSF